MLSISPFYIGDFVIYISCAVVILSLNLNFICFHIDMLVHNITVPECICLCILYNIIIGCTSYWCFCYISLLCVGCSTTSSLLYLRLN